MQKIDEHIKALDEYLHNARRQLQVQRRASTVFVLYILLALAASSFLGVRSPSILQALGSELLYGLGVSFLSAAITFVLVDLSYSRSMKLAQKLQDSVETAERLRKIINDELMVVRALDEITNQKRHAGVRVESLIKKIGVSSGAEGYGLRAKVQLVKSMFRLYDVERRKLVKLDEILERMLSAIDWEIGRVGPDRAELLSQLVSMKVLYERHQIEVRKWIDGNSEQNVQLRELIRDLIGHLG